jgi:MarR family transcriptional regulator, organic hydroperoxide resistance regulator
METQKDLLTKQIVSAIRRMTRVIYLDSRKMVKMIGLSNPQCLVLKAIDANGPSSLASMSRYLNVTPANMTGLVDRLEKKGLVRRTRKIGDRRVTIVELTDKGRPLSQSVPDPIEEKLVSGLKDVTPIDLRQIVDAFQKVVDLLDAKEVADAPLDPDPSSWPTLNNNTAK